MGKNYNGPTSPKFTKGSNVHNGAPISPKSGTKDYSYKPPTRQPRQSRGPSIGQQLFGPGPKVNTHGPGTRKKKR